MGSASRVLLVSLVLCCASAAQQSNAPFGGVVQGPAPAGRVLPPTYPWVTEPIDAIYGHLTEGGFKEPMGVCFEPRARELYVADSRNGLIGIFDDQRIPVFVFGGPALLVEPKAVIALEDGTICVLDALQSELHVFTYRGEPQPSLRFPRPPRAPKEAKQDKGGSLRAPNGSTPAVKPTGDGAGRPPAAGSSSTNAPAGAKAARAAESPPKPFLRIGAVAHDAQGRWYVGDLDEGRVIVYDAELRFVRELEASVRAQTFHTPVDIAVSSTGFVAVADMQTTPAIHVYDDQGRLYAAFGEREVGLMNFTAPSGVAFDEQGYLYGVDLLRHDVKVFTTKGEFVYHFGGWFTPETRGRAPGEMLYPTDIAIDPQGTIYVSERYGQRVQAFARKLKEPPAKPAGAAPAAPAAGPR